MSRCRAALLAAVQVVAGAGLAWLLVGPRYPNYDTLYGMVWSAQLFDGTLPDLTQPLAPTPKPLLTILGLVLAPLDAGAATVVEVGSYLALGALGAVAHRLTAHYVGAVGGIVAALIVLTRVPVLSFGVRGYLDIAYAALVLGALGVELRRPRAGTPVLVLLGVAGLLRPEAWLLAAAYLLWLALAVTRRRLAACAALAAAAPALWLLHDLALTGDALWSLTGTRTSAAALERPTGLWDALRLGPRRAGEIVREPVLAGAALGAILALLAWPRRVAPLLAGGLVAAAAFVALALVGLPVLGRYLIAPALLLVVLAVIAMLGWRTLSPSHPLRAPWMAAGALVAVLLTLFAIPQARQLDRIDRVFAAQQRIGGDLRAIIATGSLRSCGPVWVGSHHLVPLLAFWMPQRPEAIRVGDADPAVGGVALQPASPRVARLSILDPNEPGATDRPPPVSFRPAATNRSWRTFARCPTPTTIRSRGQSGGAEAHQARGTPRS